MKVFQRRRQKNQSTGMKNLTEEEKYVRKKIEEVYPQLVINARKVSTTNFYKWGLDLITTVVEFFLNKPIEQQLKTIEDGKLENMLTFMMSVQLRSTSSRFYSEFRKHTLAIRELYTDYQYTGMDYNMEDGYDEVFQSELMKCVDYHARELDVYKRMVYEEILRQGKTYTEVSKHYKINYNHLRETTEELRQYFNDRCEHCFDDDFDY